MFQHNSVCDSGDALSFVEAYRGHERPGRNEKYFLPLPFTDLWDHIGANRHRRTATAAAPGVCVWVC